VYLICVTVASFTVLAQPAVAQGANTTLTYPAQVLQGDGSQTCPSEAQRERVRNEVMNATRSLLQELPPSFYCGGTGWRRIAYLNMSDPSQQCPSAWREIPTPHRVYGRRSSGSGCEGLNYITGSGQYNQVCGRIIGYQIGHPDAFRGSFWSIDDKYAEAVCVTHGFPRQHIYTFWPNGDPLWDGQGCGPTSSCCSFNSPPWFNVRLPNSTTDYIEVRICGSGTNLEDVPIQLMELYVK